jgi:hypothetical protein
MKKQDLSVLCMISPAHHNLNPRMSHSLDIKNNYNLHPCPRNQSLTEYFACSSFSFPLIQLQNLYIF